MKKKIIIPWILPLLLVVNANAQWTNVSVPTNQLLTNGTFTDDLHGYVSASYYPVLWRTANGGTNWDSTVFTYPVVDMDFSSNNEGYVLLRNGNDHYIHKTADGGVNWTLVSFPINPAAYFTNIITKNPNEFFVSSYDYLLKTADGGANYDTVFMAGYPMPNDKEKIDNDTIMFTGWDGTFAYQGAIVKSYDGGNTWTYLPTNDDYTNFAGTSFINGMSGFGVYGGGWGPDTAFLTMTTDGGNSWNVVHTDTSITYTDVFMKGMNEGYIAYTTDGYDGHILFTNDGINYTLDYSGNNVLNRMYHAQNTLFVIGTDGTVIKKSVPLGILDNEISNLEIYPNPASDYLQIQSDGMMNISISDMSGKMVFQKVILPNERMDVRNLANGFYTIKSENGNKIAIGKLVIAK